MVDASDVMSPWFVYCCMACGMPTETEPCREHQPDAWKEYNR